MIDFILIVFIACMFYAGFWSGKTFGTLGAMFTKAKATASDWLKG